MFLIILYIITTNNINLFNSKVFYKKGRLIGIYYLFQIVRLRTVVIKKNYFVYNLEFQISVGNKILRKNSILIFFKAHEYVILFISYKKFN